MSKGKSNVPPLDPETVKPPGGGGYQRMTPKTLFELKSFQCI
jgi:hypothetical protein